MDSSYWALWYHSGISDWHSELRWNLAKLKGKSLKLVILRISWRDFLYFIWKERNNRVVAQKFESPQQVFDWLCATVKIRLSKLNFTPYHANTLLLENLGGGGTILMLYSFLEVQTNDDMMLDNLILYSDAFMFFCRGFHSGFWINKRQFIQKKTCSSLKYFIFICYKCHVHY